MTMTVRTRVAPSPTGDPHVGTAYIALFNLLFAKSHGGQFILRIEDTDQQRSSAESEQMILESLKWLGLTWDEGPDMGGSFGPYRQSERSAIYQQHAKILLDNEHAYHCFCSSQRLDQLRKEQITAKQTPKYDGCCLSLTAEEVSEKIASGESYVIRMKIPEKGTCRIEDMLRGIIEIDWSQLDMQILLKADGMPTYHLANVVDDHLMQITHVIRGEEWINSAPKHQLLYRYFNWEMPQLCHMPLLRNPDKSKLSKRKNPTSINYYRRMGYLPEALLNYLGRMGWSMPDEREKFTFKEMLAVFDLQRVSLGGPVFDQEKLSWLNGTWIREELTATQLMEQLSRLFDERFVHSFLPMAQARIEKLTDLAPLVGFMFSGMLSLTKEQFNHKKMDEVSVKQWLQFVLWQLEKPGPWHRERIFSDIKLLASGLDLKLGDAMQPIFIAVVGSSSSWSVTDSMAILGADVTRARLRHGIAVLGGSSNKALKKQEKQFCVLMKSLSV